MKNQRKIKVLIGSVVAILIAALVLMTLIIKKNSSSAFDLITAEKPAFFNDIPITITNEVVTYVGGNCTFAWNPNEWVYTLSENEVVLSRYLNDGKKIEVVIMVADGMVDNLSNYYSYIIQNRFDVPFYDEFIGITYDNSEGYLGIKGGFIHTNKDSDDKLNTILSTVNAYSGKNGTVAFAVLVYGEKTVISEIYNEHKEIDLDDVINSYSKDISDSFSLLF